MAITKENLGNKLQLRSNYGVIDGKDVIRSRTYANVKADAANDGLYAVAEAIGGLQEPSLEDVILVESSLLLSI